MPLNSCIVLKPGKIKSARASGGTFAIVAVALINTLL